MSPARTRFFAAVFATPFLCAGIALAQGPSDSTKTGVAKKAITQADYARWRTIEGAELSPDGKWVSYVYRFTNVPTTDSKPVLHIVNLSTNADVSVPNGSAAEFSSDSRWIVYQIDTPAGGGRGGRGGAGAGGANPPATPPSGATPPGTPPTGDSTGRGGTATPPPPPRRVELRDLATGKVLVWQDMQSASFSPTATHLLMRRRAPGGATPPAGATAGSANNPPAPRGTDVVLHELATGRSQFFGSVADIAFNRQGDLLAYTVDAAFRDGNGLFLFDPKAGRTHTLDNDARNYNRLTWNDDGNGIAVLKGREVEKMRERNNVLAVFADVRAAIADPEYAPSKLEPATATAFPKGWVISDRAPLSFSDDNKRVFFGIMPQSATPDTSRRRSADSVADVDVWRTQDERIQSVQMIRAEADRNFTFRSAFDVTAAKFIPLADSTMRDVDVAADGRWAVGRDARAYISDYARARADFYRVNTATGERTLMFKGQLSGQHVYGISPDGNIFLYWKDNKFQSYNLNAAATKTLGGATAPSFVNMEFDNPGPRPSYGVSGYTSDGANVIVHNRYDLWVLPLDGTTAPRSITNGAGTKSETRFRYTQLEPIDPLAPRAVARRGIDLSKPITLSAYGEWTKKSGFYTLANGELKEIMYEDASFSVPAKALKADRFLLTRQTFVDFPDLRIADANFKESKKITDANPQQGEFLWGRRVLFDFKNKAGVRLQGILALPDDYKPGEKRPMLVTFYEKNSQGMHRYTPPSFISGMGNMPVEAVSRGYITMLPDVHFKTGSSHSDMLDAVEAATRKVIEMGYVDPKKIGVHGHSYGGEGAAFIGVRSKMFAAIGMGAGVTDLYSDFSQSWGWSYQVTGGSGANGNDYYLFGQGRWGFSPWDKPEVYRFESALTHVPNASAPFLIMHGTADPTVSFSEGMNFYNALRYNNKTAVMLAYPGEGHGLRGLANRKDLTTRYFQFFDHYLKGAPAPAWITEGVPFLKKDAVKEPK